MTKIRGFSTLYIDSIDISNIKPLQKIVPNVKKT